MGRYLGTVWQICRFPFFPVPQPCPGTEQTGDLKLHPVSSAARPRTKFHFSSQRVAVKGALVAEIQELLLGVLCLDGVLALAREQFVALPVFALVRLAQDPGTDHAGDAEAQAGAEAGRVARRLGRKVDVAAADAAQVADGDQERHADGALRRRGQVVGDQRDDARERAVEARGDQEQEEVRHARVARVRNRQLRDEPGDADREATDNKGGALLDVVRPEGHDDCGDHGHDVDGDRHELRVRGAVAHLADDRRHRGREAVGADAAGPKGPNGDPDLPVGKAGPDVRPGDLVVVGDAAVAGPGVQGDAVDHELALFLGQEPRRLRLVG